MTCGHLIAPACGCPAPAKRVIRYRVVPLTQDPRVFGRDWVEVLTYNLGLAVLAKTGAL